MRIHRVVVAAIAGLALVLPAAPTVAAPSIAPDVVAVASKARLAAPASAVAGSEVTFTLRFPSKARSFTVVTDWGDGSAPTTLQGSSSATTKRAQLTHSFAQPGTFVVAVTVGRLQATRSIIITSASTSVPSPSPTPTAAAEEWQIDMLARVNALRASVGVGPVSLCPALGRAAQKHAADMAARNYFEHNTPDGLSPGNRINAEGYQGGWGENIAAGYADVPGVMAGWIDSPGHYQNLVRPSFSHVGFGKAEQGTSAYGVYWAQNFGYGGTC